MLDAHEDQTSSAANLVQVNDPSVPEPSKPAADSEASVDHATHEVPAPTAVETIPHDLASAEPDIDKANDVQTALERLNDGNYWTDEITGEPIADDVLAAHPTARTATPTLG